MAKLAFLLIVSLSFTSCLNSEPYYDKEFYETISGIKFPKKARAIESADNGEFVTITVFKADSSSLSEFAGLYKFDTAKKPFEIFFWGKSYLKVNKPDFSAARNLYYKTGSKGKNSWKYVVDMDSKKLWVEIQYPDWAGD